MNLAEKMALDCGVKISEPYLDKLYFPLKSDRFIIFDTRSRYKNGEYDFYNDVYDLIKDYIKENNIESFQIANENSYRIPCNKCFITINKKQEAYLIDKSLLVVANENYSLYMAAALNKKSVGLYSVFDYRNTSPVWNKDSQIIIASHRDGNKPSYDQLNESPKTINFINPYLVAWEILDALNIEHDLHKYELVHIGENYNNKIVEIVPDFITETEFLANKAVNLRLDLVQSIDVRTFQYWLSNRKVNLITDRDLNVNLLAPLRGSIIALTVMLSDNITEAFLKACKSIGLKIKLFCADKNKLNEYRFKFLDWEVEKDYNEKISLEDLKDLKPTSRFVSSKIIISKGKQYSCKANFFKQKPVDNSEEEVVLSEQFAEELEYFKIYNVKT